jgi:hypothetical protein
MCEQNNPNRIRAKRLLTHYFSELFNVTGLKWDSDNRAELNDLVDCLIDAACDQMKANIPEEEQAGKSYAEYFHGIKPHDEVTQ